VQNKEKVSQVNNNLKNK